MKCLTFFLLGLLHLTAAARPIVIAHRGASGYAPEHTRGAVTLAHAQGADFIEQDIVLTRDDVPVVLHDTQLDTISDAATLFPDRHRPDGHWYALDFTLAELRRLNLCERVSPKTGKAVYPARFPHGSGRFQILTLEEEFQIIQGLNRSTGRTAGVYPEIKQPAWHRREGHDISRIVLPILRRYGYQNRTDACWLQCFELEEIRRLRGELAWQGRLVLLTGGRSKTGPDRLFTAEGLAELTPLVDGIGPPLSVIVDGATPDAARVTDFVALAHAQKLQVHPYTLRTDDLPKCAATPAALLDLLITQAGIDGLFTDFPDTVIHWLDRPSPLPK